MKKEQLHELVWRRFIRMPYGHLLDYADENGFTTIPTPEECAASNPNPMGWWTPIENGSFFGGLYLEALIEGYRQKPNKETAKCIRTLAEGLFLMQDVAQKDGFIARGVATDGVSHYVCSSDDQVFPWVLALVSYAQCPVCPDPDAVRRRVLKTLRAVWNKDGAVPCDTEFECDCAAMLDQADWRETTAVLYSAYAMYLMSGEQQDLERYVRLRDGKPGRSDYSRAEIVSHGFAHNMVRKTHLIQFWIDVSYHLAAGKLARLDAEKSSMYAQGCRSNGITAVCFAEDLQVYDNRYGGFGLDWRKISPLSKPFAGDLSAARKNAEWQNQVWCEKVVPHRYMEHVVLGNAIFGLWIALTCGDTALEAFARQKLQDNIEAVDWNSLTTSYAFAAESCMIFAEMD